MLLEQELERNIIDAWLSLREKILSDPDELRRRLTRRRMKSLIRPPRAWCIALRASDRRITAMHWVISPEHAMDLNHPEHPYEPIEHEVWIRQHGVRRICHAVCFSREQAVEVAKMLGVSRGMVWYARTQGVFAERFLKGLGGKRGKPVPLLSNGGILMDPSYGFFWRRPHEVWGGAWAWLGRELPEDFEQMVVRRPVFRRMDGVKVQGWHSGMSIPPEGEGEGASEEKEEKTSNVQRSTFNVQREEERRTGMSAPPAEEEQREFPDEWQHMGWKWVCPSCSKEVRTIYYPVAVRTLFDIGEFDDPAVEMKLDEWKMPQPVGKFACAACHDVQYFSTVEKGSWNKLIFAMTAGMLYGREVKRPEGLKAERLRTRVRRMGYRAPVREKVLTRLRLGWTDLEMSREMGKSLNAVRSQVRIICRQEGVKNRRELAVKLGFTKWPPKNQEERAKERREKVLEMMLAGVSWKKMMEGLSMSREVLKYDVGVIYRRYGVEARGRRKGRRELASRLAAVNDECRNPKSELMTKSE